MCWLFATESGNGDILLLCCAGARGNKKPESPNSPRSSVENPMGQAYIQTNNIKDSLHDPPGQGRAFGSMI